jgi:hypothetical protein
MPSPRPLGSGALKILSLPQRLEDFIFDFIAFFGCSMDPLLCALFRGAVVRYCPRDLHGYSSWFIVFHFSCAGVTTSASPVTSSSVQSSSSIVTSIPTLLGTIVTEMAFLSTIITVDFPYVEPAPLSSSSRWIDVPRPKGAVPLLWIINVSLF